MFVNTYVVIIISNAASASTSQEQLWFGSSFFGYYEDIVGQWYPAVGNVLVVVMLMQILLPQTGHLVYELVRTIRRYGMMGNLALVCNSVCVVACVGTCCCCFRWLAIISYLCNTFAGNALVASTRTKRC